MAKGKNINGTVRIFNDLPNTWGNIISGFANLSDSELASKGFYNIVMPEGYNSKIHNLGNISFDTDNKVYTYPKTNKTWSETLAQLKTKKITEVKMEAKSKLSITDWYVIRKTETNEAIPSEIVTQRSNLRTAAINAENEIKALSSKSAVVAYKI